MSARREKRLRQLERRVSALENLAAMPTMVIKAESDPAGMSTDVKWMPTKPKRGILQQIMDFFSGREDKKT